MIENQFFFITVTYAVWLGGKTKNRSKGSQKRDLRDRESLELSNPTLSLSYRITAVSFILVGWL